MATRFFQGLRLQPRASGGNCSRGRFESSVGLESRMAISILPERSDVPLKDTWDTESIFPSVTAWEAALEALKESVFGRALNIAERSRLRGFYEREKLLKRW